METQQAIFNEKLSVYFSHIDEFLSDKIDDDKLEMLQNQWDNLQKKYTNYKCQSPRKSSTINKNAGSLSRYCRLAIR